MITHNHAVWKTKHPGSPLVDCQTILYKIFHISPFKFELHDSKGQVTYTARHGPKFRNSSYIHIYHMRRLLGHIDDQAVFRPKGEERPHRVFSRWYRRMTNPMYPYKFKEKP